MQGQVKVGPRFTHPTQLCRLYAMLQLLDWNTFTLNQYISKKITPLKATKLLANIQPQHCEWMPCKCQICRQVMPGKSDINWQALL